MLPVAAVAALVLVACTHDNERVSVGGREDLELVVFDAAVTNGHTERLRITIPDGTASFLVEVRGSGDNFYFLDSFVTPTGEDLIASDRYDTREAREVAGLADFLYPNDGSALAEPGDYELALSARDRKQDGNLVASDRLEVRVYVKRRDELATCGIQLDFLVDNTAIDAASFEAAVDTMVGEIDSIYRRAGIAVINYQIQRVNLRSPDVNIGDRSALVVADDVLAQARNRGSARQDSLHVLLVRTIRGTESPFTFDPAGYSMGLPGPYDADRPNAVVLVSTEHYARSQAGELVLDALGLSTSLAHEIGHFMGLYHTSESGGVLHDPLGDTPECKDDCSDPFLANIMSSAFWLQQAARDPRYRMNLTRQQATVVRGHPLCIPHPVAGPPSECTLQCAAPTTCAALADRDACLPACDPRDATPCASGTCTPDRRGTYVCQP